MWIARDETGKVWAYNKKPQKTNSSGFGQWIPAYGDYCGALRVDESELARGLANISWDDDEPCEVVLKPKGRHKP